MELKRIIEDIKKKMNLDENRKLTTIMVPDKIKFFCKENDLSLFDLLIAGYYFLNIMKRKNESERIDLFSRAVFEKLLGRKIVKVPIRTITKIYMTLKDKEDIDYLYDYIVYFRSNKYEDVLLTEKEYKEIREILAQNDKNLLNEFENGAEWL